ncbi:unnamed protein product [Echinostoma caproni]|uniref:Uncharacterized protein n=1 Tax=Echinostoma caproni TaxID=27848 RepID=A0A183AYY8_9TREM|nr:unnamed protein product [Echinostoma caproni]
MNIRSKVHLWKGINRDLIKPTLITLSQFADHSDRTSCYCGPKILSYGSCDDPPSCPKNNTTKGTSPQLPSSTPSKNTIKRTASLLPRFGPMDPVSNIRPVHFDPRDDETALQRKYRLFYADTWKWLDRYWAAHNIKLMQAKREFLESENKRVEHLSPDNKLQPDLSDFHARFLEENRKSQMKFNL